jgi:hypothetical protein
MGKMIVGKKLKEASDINLYRPADFDGKVLHLHYARAEERPLPIHGYGPGGGLRAVLAEAGGFVGGDESGRVGVGQVGHALLWLPARKPAVRLRLELGSFSCHSSPIALTVEAVWRLGRARAKGGCRLRELNRIGWRHR